MSEDLERKIKYLQESCDCLLTEVSRLEQKLIQREADCNFYKKLLDDCIEAMKVDAKRIEGLSRGKT